MIRTIQTLPLLLITIATVLLTPLGNVLSANQEVITEDGREVLLKEDGTWVFRSTDRFANTKEGRRVRLKNNGSWQYTGNVPLKSKNQVRSTDLDIKLKKVVIETYEKKIQKNKRIKTQTVFYVNLELSPLAKRNISINKNDLSLIEVKDNKGKIYPVLSIQPNPTTLKPNTNTTLVIRAEKSPSVWNNAKSMDIIFMPGIFGLQEPITFSQKVIDFENKNVDGFEKIK